MRFLQAIVAKETSILHVVERFQSQVPQYAILSHTWEDGEIKFEDIESGRAEDVSAESLATMASTSPSGARSLLKLKNACIQAANDGYEYIWIDSCCIDKRNSAELSEAINSMFAWYRDATVCYAFLLNAPDHLDTVEARTEFAANRWFQRGFTLQELLAPTHVIFFSGNWITIGKKILLCDLLSQITGIDTFILKGDLPLNSMSVARRMSWAAKRVTTRPEDIAYCLMGIFSVNMPMLYGEGAENAFIRLQEEIMKQSDDQSLFAWVIPESPPDEMRGLLATSPSQFLVSKGIVPYQDWQARTPYAITNRGLRIDLHLTLCDGSDNVYVAALDCPVPPDYKDSSFLALYLLKLSGHDEQYARIKVGQFANVRRRGNVRTVYIRQKPHTPSPEGAYPYHHIQLRSGPNSNVYPLVHMMYSSSEIGVARIPARDSVRDWVQSKWPFVFQMRKEPAQLSMALIFQHERDDMWLVVLIGSLNGFDIAFDVHEGNFDSNQDWDVVTFKQMEAIFNPTKDGKFERGYHSVMVSATPVVQSPSMYYLVDIDIVADRLSLRGRMGKALSGATESSHQDSEAQTSRNLRNDNHVGVANGKDKKKPLWKRIVQGPG